MATMTPGTRRPPVFNLPNQLTLGRFVLALVLFALIEVEVIVDAMDPEVPGHAVARGHADAPEIDCAVRLKGKNLRPGDLVRARVTGADGYDLIARAIKVR